MSIMTFLPCVQIHIHNNARILTPSITFGVHAPTGPRRNQGLAPWRGLHRVTQYGPIRQKDVL